ncbi:TPA: hypothetical protein N0F65_011429 [Lagenidium giganteum]|uniref:DUF1279 domain-containing protein n=1 Tax=Lagenidium giganteum TaxID=4803 RepID=A0AAV2ZEH3_9STRA|nr:TPA: hypothetical protein N0F65_011429 [Lagenidium giganteum]
MVFVNGAKRAFGANAWQAARCASAPHARTTSQLSLHNRDAFRAAAALPRSTRQWAFKPVARFESRCFATVPNTEKTDEEAPAVKKTYAELEAEIAALQKEIAELKKAGEESKMGKLMSMFKKYGPALLIWWTTLYVGTGVGIYTGLETGMFGGADALHLIKSFGLDQYIDLNSFDPKYGNVALAFLLNELVEPVRAPIAFATIPTIKRIFTRNPTPSA